MNIKSIKIKKYKSVNSPQTIEIGNSGLVTLIGKNGSGKTNILEAVNKVFEINRREYYYGRDDLQYSVILELDKDILKEFKDNIKNPQDRFIEVYNDGRGNDSDCWKVNVFRSQMFANALKSAASDLKSRASELSDKLKIFKKKLSEIQIKDEQYSDGYFYNIEELSKSQTCNYLISNYAWQIEELLNDTDKIIKTICNNEHEIKLNGFDGYAYYQHSLAKFIEPDFHLVYHEPYMTEFDKRFIVTIDRDKIKYYIEEFNKRIAEKSTELKQAVNELNEKINQFNKLIKKARKKDEEVYLKKEEEENKESSFFNEVEKAIGRKSYYIPGGDNLIFKENYDARRYTYNELLIKTYIGLKYDGAEREKLLTEYDKKKNLKEVLKNLNIDAKSFAKDFENELNNDIPSFDRDMITKIEVDCDGGIDLFVIEKDNTKTPFADTSLGRRWYFTYYFIKKCLKPGDVFLLDEPGAFLHPEAQTELLHDLEEIAKSNTVIMCTHSPYMISEKFNNIHIVRMQKGTTVSHINLKSLEKLRKDCGLLCFNSIAFNSIILNFPKEQILCEGPRDIACINAFMDYFKIDKKNYSVNQIIGYPHAKTLIEFYVNNNMHLMVVLDKDSENRLSEKTIKVPKGLNESESLKICEIPKEYLTLVYVGEENGRQDIEGLFSEDDRKTYLEKTKGKGMKVKMNIGELLPKHGCDDETEKNFRRLFLDLNLPFGK